VRLFLDAHISAHRLGQALRRAGHDVRSADEERALDGWTDADLLALASQEGRIMVTFNVRDFPRLAREWAEAGRTHAGCAILVGIDHSEFGTILRVLERVFTARPDSPSPTTSRIIGLVSRRHRPTPATERERPVLRYTHLCNFPREASGGKPACAGGAGTGGKWNHARHHLRRSHSPVAGVD
jgi:hypothetical protein